MVDTIFAYSAKLCVLYSLGYQAHAAYENGREVMQVQDFALRVDLLRKFNFVSMYAEAVVQGKSASQNPIDIAFGLGKVCTKEEAIAFMCDYLSGFNRRTKLKPTDFIILYH